MILSRLRNSPEKMVPVAMALIVAGLSIFMIAIVWPHFSPSPSFPHPGTDSNDFFQGVLFGIAIAMEITAVVIAITAIAASKKRKPL